MKIVVVNITSQLDDNICYIVQVRFETDYDISISEEWVTNMEIQNKKGKWIPAKRNSDNQFILKEWFSDEIRQEMFQVYKLNLISDFTSELDLYSEPSY